MHATVIHVAIMHGTMMIRVTMRVKIEPPGRTIIHPTTAGAAATAVTAATAATATAATATATASCRTAVCSTIRCDRRSLSYYSYYYSYPPSPSCDSVPPRHVPRRRAPAPAAAAAAEPKQGATHRLAGASQQQHVPVRVGAVTVFASAFPATAT